MSITKTYSTISCPCSSYAIGLEDGNIGCERNNFGVIESITPVLINNHLINNRYPKKGDKWLCTGLNCKQGDFQWDTFHVVNVTEDATTESDSLLNSKKSTSVCHIPLAKNLTDYSSGDTSISMVGTTPLFEDEESAKSYNFNLEGSSYSAARQSFREVEKYNKDGLSGYLPVDKFGEEKLITNITVNGVNLLDRISPDFKTLFNDKHDPGKMVFASTGDIININMNSVNSPSFTLSLKDSSGCNIFKKKYKNVVCKNTHSIKEIIPSLPQGAVSEVYSLKISLAADVKYYNFKEIPTNGVINVKIYQYKNPKLTFAINDSTLDSCTTTTDYDGNETFSGGANSLSKTGFTYTTTLTSTTKNLYIKDPTPGLGDLVIKDNIIKKIVIRENTTDTSDVGEIKVRSKAFLDSSNNVIYQGDVENNMVYSSSVSRTETIRKSIDLDIHKEPCDDCDELDILTNKFEIDNTRDIFVGMRVWGVDYNGKLISTSLQSIDSNKNITLEGFYTINKDTDLTFDYDESGTVEEVINSSNGDQSIVLSGTSRLPHGSEVTFESGVFTNVQGYTRHSISGALSIVFTTIINRIKYGQEDVTFTLDLDELVTYTPNNFDQYLTVGKNSSVYVNTTIYDSDFNSNGKTTVISMPPANGTFVDRGTSGWLYEPLTNFTGKDKITFSLTSPDVGGSVSTSAEKTIFITVK